METAAASRTSFCSTDEFQPLALENMVHILSLVLQTARRCMICTSVILYMLYNWITKKQRGSLVSWCQPGLQQQDLLSQKTKERKNNEKPAAADGHTDTGRRVT